MSDTPRTDHEEYEGKFSGFCNVIFARQLEREITVVKADRDAWNYSFHVANKERIEGPNRETFLAAVRYEKLRRLTPVQFRDLCSRNLNGENFDEMVDKL